jgi:hypothetical protein
MLVKSTLSGNINSELSRYSGIIGNTKSQVSGVGEFIREYREVEDYPNLSYQ